MIHIPGQLVFILSGRFCLFYLVTLWQQHARIKRKKTVGNVQETKDLPVCVLVSLAGVSVLCGAPSL